MAGGAGRVRNTCLACAALLLPLVASAQTPGIFPPSTGLDVFAAPPGTYEPRFDRTLTPRETGLWFPPSTVVWPTLLAPAPPLPPVVIVVVQPPERSTVVTPVVTPPATPLPAATPPAPGLRKPLYVIPRCYAGDKRPRPDQLRSGCRLSDLRIISPNL
jgi:hypothetical protein